ncbi:hypothetical protein GCM10008090_35100 [Arenicella chitinivorans]|uniref:Uncharacterized protein n=1 Tax=Arenicella chitinivorans TaxID=1329800 RepID=A0A918S3P4_9GAMM|nr:hypothetical protein GCM10008090_35100 [Arenicella chitinivorans]
MGSIYLSELLKRVRRVTGSDKLGVEWPLDDFHFWGGLKSLLFLDRVELAINVGPHAMSVEQLICDFD